MIIFDKHSRPTSFGLLWDGDTVSFSVYICTVSITETRYQPKLPWPTINVQCFKKHYNYTFLNATLTAIKTDNYKIFLVQNGCQGWKSLWIITELVFAKGKFFCYYEGTGLVSVTCQNVLTRRPSPRHLVCSCRNELTVH